MQDHQLTAALTSAVLALALAFASPVWAGVVEHDVSGGVAHVDDGRLRIESGGDVYVVDSQRGTVTVILRRKRIYATGTIREACAAVQSVAASRRGIQKAKGKAKRGRRPGQSPLDEGLPQVVDETGGTGFVAVPDAVLREGESGQVEGQVPVRVEYIGPGEEIAGYRTGRYRVSHGDAPYAEVWIAKDRDLADEMNRLDLGAIFRLEACGAGPSVFGGDPPDPDIESSRPYRRLMAMGWLMKKVRIFGNRRDLTSQVARLRRENMGGNLFMAPGGYKEISMRTLLRKHIGKDETF